MASSSEQKAVERLSRVINDGEGVISSAVVERSGSLLVSMVGSRAADPVAASRFETMARAAVEAIAGAESAYVRQFNEANEKKVFQGDRRPNMRAEIGVLKALKEDLEEGDFVRRISSLISAEVFSDFLEMADHLVQQGYKDPAASLAGAVLEDGLRRLARANELPVKSRDDIAVLNSRLATKDVYNLLRRKQIDSWGHIRNKADHAEFGEYQASDVSSMIAGVRGFLADAL